MLIEAVSWLLNSILSLQFKFKTFAGTYIVILKRKAGRWIISHPLFSKKILRYILWSAEYYPFADVQSCISVFLCSNSKQQKKLYSYTENIHIRYWNILCFFEESSCYVSGIAFGWSDCYFRVLFWSCCKFSKTVIQFCLSKSLLW